jgi:hypothetical protein
MTNITIEKVESVIIAGRQGSLFVKIVIRDNSAVDVLIGKRDPFGGVDKISFCTLANLERFQSVMGDTVKKAKDYLND